jgi:polyisoprenoid-binding protein YceI
MKKVILSLVMVSALVLTSCKKESNAGDAEDVATASDDATPYVVAADGSTIEWVGSKPAGKHNGTIAVSNGEIYLNNGKIESGKFTIDMNSINVLDLAAGEGKEDLEAHLKGTAEGKEDHFFDVAKFPEATFEITAVNTVDGQTTIEGNLTLKGITKNVKFPAAILVDGDTLTITSESFVINRTDWGVNYGSKSIFDDLKDKFIEDNIELKVAVKASK